MQQETDATTVPAGELHALADLLADLTPAALTADHLDQLEALDGSRPRRLPRRSQ